MLAAPGLGEALAGLRKRRLQNVGDTVRALQDARANALMCEVLEHFAPQKFEGLAALGSKAFEFRNNETPLAKELTAMLERHFPMAWNFEEQLMEIGEYYDDGLPRLAIESIIGLPRDWDEWDNVIQELDELENKQPWSLPIFFFAAEQCWSMDYWQEMEYALGWPEGLRPKWWGRSSDLFFRDDIFRAELEKRELDEFYDAYRCVWAGTGNLFVDWDYGASGEMLLPVLSVENVLMLDEVYVEAEGLNLCYSSACNQVAEDPDVLFEVLACWNKALKPVRKPRGRTLMDVLGGGE